MSNSINNKTSVSFWILLTVSIISLGLSICALCIANSDIRGDCKMVYNYSKVIEFAGLVFTIIGAVFAFYFVIIGIDASKKKNELQRMQDAIEKINIEVSAKKTEIEGIEAVIKQQQATLNQELIDKKREIEGIESAIMEKQARIESLSKVELNHQNTLYSELINIVNNTINEDNKRSKIVDALYLSKARLATQSKFLSKDIRLEDIRRLGGIGEQSDVDDLRRIIDDSTEDEEIKELAKGIKPKIEERLKNDPK